MTELIISCHIYQKQDDNRLTSSAEHQPHSGSARHSGCVAWRGHADSGSLFRMPACQLGTTYARRSPGHNKHRFITGESVLGKE